MQSLGIIARTSCASGESDASDPSGTNRVRVLTLRIAQTKGHNAPMEWLKRLWRALVIGTIGLLLIFEEWGWEPLAALFARLARLPLWARAENWVRSLPPWGAVVVFSGPMLGLLPVKLAALALFANGHFTLGLTILVAAKLVGTAIVARLFQLTRPALMQFAWFARWYPRWTTWKDAMVLQVKQSAPWIAAARAYEDARHWWVRVNPFT